MTTRIGINGFGRIGRLAFRQAVSLPDIEVVAVNDLLDVDYMAYLLRYDSTHRRFPGSVEVENGNLIVNGKRIRISTERDPKTLAWGDVGADYMKQDELLIAVDMGLGSGEATVWTCDLTHQYITINADYRS